jgi:hypothetical protein
MFNNYHKFIKESDKFKAQCGIDPDTNKPKPHALIWAVCFLLIFAHSCTATYSSSKRLEVKKVKTQNDSDK